MLFTDSKHPDPTMHSTNGFQESQAGLNLDRAVEEARPQKILKPKIQRNKTGENMIFFSARERNQMNLRCFDQRDQLHSLVQGQFLTSRASQQSNQRKSAVQIYAH